MVQKMHRKLECAKQCMRGAEVRFKFCADEEFDKI